MLLQRWAGQLPVRPFARRMCSSSPSFSDLGLSIPLTEAVQQLGLTEPSPIQSLAIPKALAGSNLMLAAETGSGKTFAFLLPVIHKIKLQVPPTPPAAPSSTLCRTTRSAARSDQVRLCWCLRESCAIK